MKDLREFLQILKSMKELIEIDDPILPEPDVGAISKATCRLHGPALLLKKVIGFNHPILVGVHTSNKSLAIALGLSKEASLKDIFIEFSNRWERYPLPPKTVDHAPCKEVIVSEKDVDLTALPICRWNVEDGGPYIDKGVVITKNPETGVMNAGIYRMQLKGRKELGIWPELAHGVGIHYRMKERFSEPLQVAIAIGNDPFLNLSAVSPLDESWDELSFAGALRGEPLKVVRAEKVDLFVPAYSEFILEGIIETDSDVRELEGPFAEYTGYYAGVFKTPVIKIVSISCRKNPIYEGLYAGRPMSEVDYITQIPSSVAVYRQVKKIVPEIQFFNLASTWTLTGIASMRQSYGGQAKQLMNAIWATPFGTYIKNLFIVDDDVDPFDINQVLWALSVRFRGEDDIVSIRKAPGSMLDPSAVISGMSTKIGFDLTQPKPPDTVTKTIGVVRDRPETEKWCSFLESILKEEKTDLPSKVNGREVQVDICPRCDNKDIITISNKSDWDLLKCKRCSYIWRSSEALGMLVQRSKLKENDLDKIPYMPPLSSNE